MQFPMLASLISLSFHWDVHAHSASEGLGGSPDGPLALPGPQRGLPEKPNTSVVNVNTIGVIYTARLAQYYMMKDKSPEPKALVFIGSMCEYIIQCLLNVLMSISSKSQWYDLYFSSGQFLNPTPALPKGEIYCATKHAVCEYSNVRHCLIASLGHRSLSQSLRPAKSIQYPSGNSLPLVCGYTHSQSADTDHSSWYPNDAS